MKDHVSHSWMRWRRLRDAAEQSENHGTRAELEKMDFGYGITGWGMSVDLCNVISTWAGDTLYERRTRLVEQDRFNGVELGRARFKEYEGSDIIVQMAG